MSQDELCARLQRLERLNRLLVSAFVLTIAGGVLFFVSGQAGGPQPPEKIVAQQFVLVDENGKETAGWHSGSFWMAYEKRVINISPDLGFSHHTPAGSIAIVSNDLLNVNGITIKDANGQERLGFTVDPHGARIRLHKQVPNYQQLTDRWKRAFDAVDRQTARNVFAQRSELENKALAVEIGATTLVAPTTGVKTVRPESSIVLYNNKGVLWSIP